MFIAQAFRYSHNIWRYLFGVVIIFIFSQIGTVPFIVAVMLKKIKNDGLESVANLNTSSMMSVLDSNTTLFLVLLSFAVGLLGVFLVVKYLHKQPFKSLTTSRKKTDWSRIWFSFGLLAIVSIGLILYDYAFNSEDYVVQFEMVPFLIMAVIALLLMPLQTSYEEYFFRGYLMQGIGVAVKNKWLPLIMTSLMFGGMHYWNPEVGKLGNIIMIHYIGTGFLLGIMTLMDEGLELALGFHAANNLVAAMLVTSDWTVFQTHSILKDISEPEMGFFEILIPVFVIYPIILAIMARKYNWTDWKGKLFGKVEVPVIITVSEEHVSGDISNS